MKLNSFSKSMKGRAAKRSKAGVRRPTAGLATALGLALLAPLPGSAQDEMSEKGHTFGLEVRTHYRDSDFAQLPSPFPFLPSSLPVGQERGFLETVDAGDSFEVSVATVFYRGTWGEQDQWGAKAKVDLIDKHDRNPTSDDNEWDVDELWLRFGSAEVEPGDFHEGISGYAKLGKFPKFERQNDRHLESYGLIGTSFNRAEDVGLELGFDIGRHFYLRSSFTQGNPVFYRDPNALAGDHGTEVLISGPNPVPELQTGFPILYDADVELDNLNFGEPEVGLGLGGRFGNERWSLDLLAFGYRRDLADTVELEGTIYGGDLDLLLGPGNAFPLVGIAGDQKEEFGLTLWFYFGGFSAFGQYVDQEVAGLERDGFEVELAWDIELPWFGSLFGRQVLPFVAPAVRYSEIDPHFGFDRSNPFPAPSVTWDWEKLDLGIRLGLVDGWADLTLEYADNEFLVGNKKESADEFLATLRIMWDTRLGS